MRIVFYRIVLFALSLLFTSITSQAQTDSFTVSSPAVSGSPETGYFSHLTSTGRVDSTYAAKDKAPANTRSLPVTWKNVPEGTKVLALLLDDPDAKPVMEIMGMKGDAFIHWIASDIPPVPDTLKDNASKEKHSFVQGKNSMGKIGYTGPKPPSDIPKDAQKPIIHIYRLTLYALNAPTGLKNGFTLEDFKNAIKEKTIKETQLRISYSN
jgi:Raf kinase inhibitor-like YbhB/YbcL family protein